MWGVSRRRGSVGAGSGIRHDMALNLAQRELQLQLPLTVTLRLSDNVPRSFIVAMSLSRAAMLSRGSTRAAVPAGRRALERCAGCGARAEVGRFTQKRWASNKPGADNEQPFYLQLQETIQERVQKEKAEQIQIQSLQQRTARGKFWATITGMGSPRRGRRGCQHADPHQPSRLPARWATTMAS